MRKALKNLVIALLLAPALVHAEAPEMEGFYSALGTETQVEFDAVFRVPSFRAKELRTGQQRAQLEQTELRPTLAFLFGPLGYRRLGTPKTEADISVDWSRLSQNGDLLEIPYHYRGTWIVSQTQFSAGGVQVPVPYNKVLLLMSRWQSCTDTAANHKTVDYLWYFWDPSRQGCTQREGKEYQSVRATFLNAAPATKRSYPEYRRMIHGVAATRTLSMTFAFGYMVPAARKNIETDNDKGLNQYKFFLGRLRGIAGALTGGGLKETPIYSTEYIGGAPVKIGTRLEGVKEGVKIRYNLVVAGAVDQLELFAKSFARDHDAFFGWFGHSRSGSDFDSEQLRRRLEQSPGQYSITQDYQLVYWGSCNSYASYVEPFFHFKAQANPLRDSRGTRNLDIMTNGIYGYFDENAEMAAILARAFLSWAQPVSYQELINKLEWAGSSTVVLVNVSGDEDNPSTPR